MSRAKLTLEQHLAAAGCAPLTDSFYHRMRFTLACWPGLIRRMPEADLAAWASHFDALVS